MVPKCFELGRRSRGCDRAQRRGQVNHDQGELATGGHDSWSPGLLASPCQALVGELPVAGKSIVWKHPNVGC